MVNGLEMPQSFAGMCIQRQDAIAKQVASGPIRTVVVIRRRSNRKIGNAAIFINRNLTPCVGAAYIFIGLLRPSVITIFTGMRNGVENPYQLTRDDMIGT